MGYNHTIYSKAKINLFLHVLGLNDKKYHLLESLVCFTDDLYDIINVYKSNELTLEIQGKFSKNLSVNDNIIIKAADFLRQGKNLGATIILTKNIPVGAGIGGGSSNAASIIKLLAKLWNIELNSEIIANLASIGADVPCCCYGNATYFSGIGEILDPISVIPKLYILLVNPNKSLLAANIFNNVKTEYSNALPNKPQSFPNSNDLINFLKNTRNDLEKAAIKFVPEIVDILDILNKETKCLLARMSGSGPTCFGLFATENDAKRASEYISDKFDWWVSYSMIS